MPTQGEQVARLRALHGDMLVLPNAWDAASARMAQEAGGAAVATSSAAVAWANGYADGEGMPRDVVLAATRAVLRVVTVPVTIDSETGYSDDPAAVAAHVLALIELGVAGINLEDGRGSPDLLAAKIAAIKAAAKARGVDIFINARCDIYLFDLVPDADKLEALMARGRMYQAAGADGFFAPLLSSLGDIAAVAQAIPLPLNVLMMKGLAPVADLQKAGARRVSAGALTGRAAYGQGARAMKMALEEGRYDTMFETSGDCPNFNAFFG
ncbi:MAG: isocitrate lyase/phosphoenolpyruvate mutase family protein [Alphaproteobacteria bacterium]|nr:isocitrate lyase/phosphoenolpyruvate mutase family protein [Alphaproteobacteria bacterium]